MIRNKRQKKEFFSIGLTKPQEAAASLNPVSDRFVVDRTENEIFSMLGLLSLFLNLFRV